VTSFAPVATFDLDLPLSLRESGRVDGPETRSADLVVHARARTRRIREWEIAQPFEREFAWQRLLSLYELSGYGTLPLRFIPPGESETIVFLVADDGLGTTRVGPLSHAVRMTLREAF
jgi:hypothetical protein